MPDYSLPNLITLIFGQGSNGKTTFALRAMLNTGYACRFIFDDRSQAAARLKLPHCGTAAECEAALSTRWVCFNPHVMFPGAKLPDGFRWFCHWAFEASKRGPGKKLLFVDELWQWANQYSMPEEFENVIRTGRTEGLGFMSATHSPREYHEIVRSQCTEFVAFNTVEPRQLKSIEPYWPAVHKAADLPRGAFLAYNRESGSELAGKLF
jgi:hypothetical protein